MNKIHIIGRNLFALKYSFLEQCYNPILLIMVQKS
jgi:hypothetical protein